MKELENRRREKTGYQDRTKDKKRGREKDYAFRFFIKVKRIQLPDRAQNEIDHID